MHIPMKMKSCLPGKLKIVLLTLLVLLMSVGCDPYSVLGSSANGGVNCERAVSSVAACCTDGQLSKDYEYACRNFELAYANEVVLVGLVEQCQSNEATFSGLQGEPLAADAALNLTCAELLDRLEALGPLWQADGDMDTTEQEGDSTETDGDTDGDIDTVIDGDIDNDVEPDSVQPCIEDQACTPSDPCMVNGICQNGVCVGEEKDCTELEDDCNSAICENGQCKQVAVDDGLPCGLQQAVCRVFTCWQGTCQESVVPDLTGCDDDNLCTENDVCLSGICEGEDVTCDDDDPCTTDSCDPEDGSCDHDSSDTDGVECDDDNPCTENDACLSGICEGEDKDCSDNNDCTVDSCAEETGICEHDSVPMENEECSDNDACTVGDRCVSGNCTPLGPKNCDLFDDECNDGACEQGDCYAQPKQDNTECNDNDLCTENDHCESGLCVADDVVCDDDIFCTDDSCNPANGECIFDNTALNGEPCDDLDDCTVNDTCQLGECLPGEDKDCSEVEDDCNGSGCMNGTCFPIPVADNSECSDGNLCTENDHCDQGDCVGDDVVCDDDVFCTYDYCDPEDGECKVNLIQLNGLDCDDDDPCTMGDVCVDGFCEPDGPMDCSELDGPCQQGVCQGGNCYADTFEDGTECSDNDPCTVNDVCDNANCVGEVNDCDDDLLCTEDECDELTGECSNTLLANRCLIDGVCYSTSQGNPEAPACAICNPGLATDDWTAVNEGEDCSSNLCWLNDHCESGVCVHDDKVCNPPQPCWAGVCNPNTGNCTWDLYAKEGQSCDPNDVCVLDALCSSGNCVGDAYDCSGLDEGCTVGECYDNSGAPDCRNANAEQGTYCDDTNAGTVNDVCDEFASCAGSTLPLATDPSSGSLLVAVTFTEEGNAAPLCIQATIDAADPQELLVNLSSPAGTMLSPALFDHEAAANPLQISTETMAFDGESRVGTWLLQLQVDSSISPASLQAFSLEFSTCPTVDGDEEAPVDGDVDTADGDNEVPIDGDVDVVDGDVEQE